jgi:outer membrane protein OmpA-like peptidoglycan-associated protein
VQGDSSSVKPEAALRDYSQYRQNSLLGLSGSMHLVAADSGPPGTFRLSFLQSTYAGSGFLCPTAVACGNRPPGVTDSQDSVRRTGQDIALSATLWSFLEASVGVHAHAVSDNFASPNLMQTIGDTSFAVKVFTPRRPDQVYSVGGLGQLRLLGGSGGIGTGASNVALGALGTLDFTNRQDPERRLPLRFHSNLGYLFDNSGSIATDTEQSRGRPITRIERFSLGINRVDSLFLGLGGVYVSALFQPFAEWTMDITSNRQGYTCHAGQLGPDDSCLNRVGGAARAPSRLSFGTRVTPPVKGLSATLGLDIGTSGTSPFVAERAPELPWNLYVGLGYSIDTYVAPKAREVANVPVVVHIPQPTQYHLVGKVVDDASSQPIAHAVIEFEGHDLTGMISGQDGTFESGSVPVGEYTLSVAADGYKSGSCKATIEQEPEALKPEQRRLVVTNPPATCPLKPVPPLGALYGRVTDVESGAPVSGARIKVRDERGRVIEVASDAAGKFSVANVPAGEARLELAAPGYLPNAARTEIKKQSEVNLSVVAYKVPKKPNVTLSPKEIKLKAPVRFAGTTSALEPDAQLLLKEVANLLLQHGDLTDIEIQSYVDDTGNAASDKRASEERGEAVKAELVGLGVEVGRLNVAGHGNESPVAPNTNEANRAKNRRIKFAITNPSNRKP